MTIRVLNLVLSANLSVNNTLMADDIYCLRWLCQHLERTYTKRWVYTIFVSKSISIFSSLEFNFRILWFTYLNAWELLILTSKVYTKCWYYFVTKFTVFDCAHFSENLHTEQKRLVSRKSWQSIVIVFWLTVTIVQRYILQGTEFVD